MLDNFKEIYDRELECYEGLEELILSSSEVRMFVYEVCKNCLPQPAVTRKPTSKEIWEWYAKVLASQHDHKPYHTGSGEVVCRICGELCSFIDEE